MKGKALGLLKSKKGLLRIVLLATTLVFTLSALAGCARADGTREPGLWDMFCQFMADCVRFFYPVFHDWGMAIIIFTIIFRVLLAPLMHKQAKSSYQMQKVQPKINEIQEKFSGDPVRQNAELQKVYAETKFNPLAGCVPMLLQMPIFMALFTALRNIDLYITDVTSFTFFNIIPDLLMSPSEALAQGATAFLPHLILLIVFAGATFLPMVLQQIGNNSSQRNQMLIMAGVMMLMMLWLGWSSPAGVLLYWGLSSLIGVAQTQLTTRYFKKRDAEADALAAENAPVKVEVTRKVQKKRPKKKH